MLVGDSRVMLLLLVKCFLVCFLQAALSVFNREHIDVLVSNAAVNPTGGPILQMEDSAIEKILQINVQSAIWLVREAVRHMTAGGSIILNSSFSAFNPIQPLGMYAVSKTALVSHPGLKGSDKKIPYFP
jgi:dehydrogenase/reductase SDR family protein 4